VKAPKIAGVQVDHRVKTVVGIAAVTAVVIVASARVVAISRS
jgi:hypothetical protein